MANKARGHEWASFDEVIAHNVNRLRKQKRPGHDEGLTVEELAGRLGVGKHLVYDMESPRAGRPQRQFTWSEVVRLCNALDARLTDLVLPPSKDDRIAVEVDGEEVSGFWWADRDWLTTELFGGPMTDEALEELRRKSEKKRSHRERQRAELEKILRDMLEKVQAEGDN